MTLHLFIDAFKFDFKLKIELLNDLCQLFLREKSLNTSNSLMKAICVITV